MLIIVMSECDIMGDSLTVRKHDITVTRLCLSPDVMAALSACYSSLFDGLNAEVQIRWLQLVVRNSFYPELPRVRAFLHKHVSNKHHRYCSARGGRGGRCGREMRARREGRAWHNKPFVTCPPSSPQTSRMYTVPLYDDLVSGVMKCVAVEIFNQTQRRLHPNLRRTLQQILFQTSTAPTNQNGPAVSIVPPSPSPQLQPTAAATASTATGTTAAIALRDVNVSA